jgi:SAM-dependent methyltransferase
MLPLHYFERVDERDDEFFYLYPRLVVHIDQQALDRVTELYRAYLPPEGCILDLMSSWRSHLPTDQNYREVVGLGMNALEMDENPQLSRFVVQNLNRKPRLPFADATFDGCVITVSVQYLTHPVDVFREIGRVLKPGAPFITTFSNRMFPSKAISVWQHLDSYGHARLVSIYYQLAGIFESIAEIDASPQQGDPLFAVVGWRQPVYDEQQLLYQQPAPSLVSVR